LSELVDHTVEMFGPLGPVQARRMFGGYGLFRGEAMFGILVDGVLFLKADEITTPLFKARGLTRFQYDRNGRPVRMSFFAAPEEVFDDRDEAELWGRRALEAAERARAMRGGRRSR
jgi:DNA transformation protein